MLPGDYVLLLFDGKVAGGRDGCNDWHYIDPPAYAPGERMIFTTLAGCLEGDPVRGAYRLLVQESRLELISENELRLVGQGHQAIFRRCEWRQVRETAPGISTTRQACTPL